LTISFAILNFEIFTLHQSRRHWGTLVGLATLNKAPSHPNLNMKHYESMEFLSIFEWQAPPHKRKTPYWKLSGDGSAYIAVRKTAVVVAEFLLLPSVDMVIFQGRLFARLCGLNPDSPAGSTAFVANFR